MCKSVFLGWAAFAVALFMSLDGSAVTRTWNPTVVVTGKDYYNWTDSNNWLDPDGNTGVPVAGDDVVFNISKTAYGGTTAALHSLLIAGSVSGAHINQTTVTLQGGGDGVSITSSGASFTWYSVLSLSGDGEVPIDIPSGKTLEVQKSFIQSGTYTTGATLVKKGTGTLRLNGNHDKWTSACSYRHTRLEAGTLLFNFWGSNGNIGPFDYFPKNHDFQFAGNDSTAKLSIDNLDLRMNNVKFYEREDVNNAEHGITSANTTNVYLRFTGVPQLASTVFSGKLYNTAGISWEPTDPNCEFVFSNAVSTTKGGLIVSNGTMRLVGGASFTQLSNVVVGAGAKFKVEKDSGKGFSAGTLELVDETSEITCEFGALSFASATRGGEPLEAKAYTQENCDWVKGGGYVLVGVDLPIAEDNWWRRSEGHDPDIAAGVQTNHTGIALSGESLALTAGEESSVAVGEGGLVTAGDGATYTYGWPTLLGAAQTWDVASGDTVSVTSDLEQVGGETLKKMGAGTVQLVGAKALVGNMVVSNGTIEAIGDESLGPDSGTTTFELTSSAYKGVLRIKPEPGKNEVSFHRPMTFHFAVDGNWGAFIFFPENTTVNLYGLMQTSNKAPHTGQGWPCHWAMSCPASTTVNWYGGMYAQLDHNFPGGTHYIHKALTGGDRFALGGNAQVYLMAPNNSVGGATGNVTSGTLYCCVPNALVAYQGKKQCLVVNGATIDLCGNDQTLGILRMTTSNSRVTSATPAFMAIGGSEALDPSNGGAPSTITNDIYFAGCAGLSMERTNYPLAVSGTSSTTGTLQVVKNTLTLRSGFSWPNSTNVVVKGGTLVIEARTAAQGKPFGKQVNFHLNSAGKLDLSIRQKCASLTTNGVAAAEGTYGSSESDAMFKDDAYFTGKGVLRVGDVGSQIILR